MVQKNIQPPWPIEHNRTITCSFTICLFHLNQLVVHCRVLQIQLLSIPWVRFWFQWGKGFYFCKNHHRLVVLFSYYLKVFFIYINIPLPPSPPLYGMIFPLLVKINADLKVVFQLLAYYFLFPPRPTTNEWCPGWKNWCAWTQFHSWEGNGVRKLESNQSPVIQHWTCRKNWFQ